MPANSSTIQGCCYNLGLPPDFATVLKVCDHRAAPDTLPKWDPSHYPKQGVKLSVWQQALYDSATNLMAIELLEKTDDVYFFQEIIHTNRPLITALTKRNFSLVHRPIEEATGPKKAMINTALALNSNRFQEIQNHSRSIKIGKRKKDIAVATAIDAKTGARIVFLSGHVPGFSFANATDAEKEPGREYCKIVIELLETLKDTHIQIVGLDINADPAHDQARFDLFTKNSFFLLNTPHFTNLNVEPPRKRTIDHVLIRFSDNIAISHLAINVFGNKGGKEKKDTSVTAPRGFADRQAAAVSGVEGLPVDVAVEPAQFLDKITLISEKDKELWTNKNGSDHLPLFITIAYRIDTAKPLE